jgi:hypothetical protein
MRREKRKNLVNFVMDLVKSLLGSGLVKVVLAMVVVFLLNANPTSSDTFTIVGRIVCDPPTDDIDGYKIFCDGELIATQPNTGPLNFQITTYDCEYTVSTYKLTKNSADVFVNDFDQDKDFDGLDLSEVIKQGSHIEYFSKQFGRVIK